MLDELFDSLRRLTQPVQVDAGGDSHFLAREDQVLSANIASGANLATGPFVPSEWTPAQAANCGIEFRHTKFHCRYRISYGGAARIVKMKLDGNVGPAVPHRGNRPLDLEWIGPTHCVRQRHVFHLSAVVIQSLSCTVDEIDKLGQGYITLEVATEGSHDGNHRGVYVRIPEHPDPLRKFIKSLIDSTVGIAFYERLTRRYRNLSFDIRAPLPALPLTRAD